MDPWLLLFFIGICYVKDLQRSPLRCFTFNFTSAQ